MKCLRILAVLLVPLTIAAQDFTQSVGQTVAFNLSAGQTAAWDPSVTPVSNLKNTSRLVLRPEITLKGRAITLSHLENGQSYVLTLLRPDGRLMMRKTLSSKSSTFLLPTSAAPGCYLATLRSGSLRVTSTLLAGR